MEKDQEMELDEVGVVDTGGDESPMAVYEVGYHLLPTLSEDEVQKAVSAIMELIKGEGGSFVGDRFPSKIDLAYAIGRRINSKRTMYEAAYFGWVAFEMSKDTIEKIKTALDANTNILRYLIVTTDREAVAAALSGAVAAMPSAPTPTGNIEKPKRVADEGGEMSEAALDQALKSIETEDAKVAE
jgi:ribosomal protein S6